MNCKVCGKAPVAPEYLYTCEWCEEGPLCADCYTEHPCGNPVHHDSSVALQCED